MMSTETDTERETDVNPAGFQPVVAIIGMLVVALGLSGLIDDSGLLTHPWWVVLVVLGIAAGAMMSVRTIRSLRAE